MIIENLTILLTLIIIILIYFVYRQRKISSFYKSEMESFQYGMSNLINFIHIHDLVEEWIEYLESKKNKK